MTPLEALAKLEADYEASTAGEWAEHYGMVRVVTDVAPEWSNSDAAHIVSMHNSAKALFAVARAAADLRSAERDCNLFASADEPDEATIREAATQHRYAETALDEALAALSEEQPS